MRNSKTGLFLMELIIVIFFFALTSAISLKVFVKAHLFDVATENSIHAVFWADNTSECFYEYGADKTKIAASLAPSDTYTITDNIISFYLDREYNSVSANSSDFRYLVSITCDENDNMETMFFTFKDTTKDSTVYESTYFKHVKEVSDAR